MKIRVLVVDDSSFFRRRLSEIISRDSLLEIVGHADNGERAVELAAALKPDVITMDVHMPVMDGIEAVRRIMRQQPTPVLMVSSLTRDGARSTLDALEAGAADFVLKYDRGDPGGDSIAARRIRQRVAALGLQCRKCQTPASDPPRRKPDSAAAVPHKLLLLGASTGGPVALQTILEQLSADYPAPVVVLQHMPAQFTLALAQRLDHVVPLRVTQVRDGEQLLAGTAYVAPGGKQFTLRRRGGVPVAVVSEAPQTSRYRPCIDSAFLAAAENFPGEVLAVVLTGMGRDGCDGARALKRTGSTIWAQDEASSIIYGMPGAVVEAGVADQVLPLHDIAASLHANA